GTTKGSWTNTGFGTFSGLSAGQSQYRPEVTLSGSTAGTFTETVVLTSIGSNGSGFSGALPTATLTIVGTVTAATLYTLTTGADVIAGANGGDVFNTTAGALNAS
ncbi:hypothetical protein, partial [Stenotrophomonas sp. A3_2]|uniref:hypothetical protein n=1 Tax=Stenotrophomonas sp. A3_2 TaxID=3119978 RepID=UPI002FC275BE